LLNLIIKIMKKNKKNFKKLNKSNNISTTPVKAEETKKEESKVSAKNVDKGAKAAANHADKAQKKLHKKANAEARVKARNKRKEELKGIAHTKASATDKTLTIEQRRERQENRRKVAYNRHIASIKRRCKRMHLDEGITNNVVEAAKKQWDSAKSYDIVMIYDFTADEKKEFQNLIKSSAVVPHMTNSTAFIKGLSKSTVDAIIEAFPDAMIYQYRTDKVSPFEEAGVITPKKQKSPKVGGKAHSIACTKNRNKNFYMLRQAKKAAEKAKAVNKKPTQVTDVHSKTTKVAA
jgi:hypothetical protein